MNDRVPTIEELMRKPRSELQAIFQKANIAATNTSASGEERAAARLTLHRVAICQKSNYPRPS